MIKVMDMRSLYSDEVIELKRKIRSIKKYLREANRGAERNALACRVFLQDKANLLKELKDLRSKYNELYKMYNNLKEKYGVNDD